MNRIIGHGLYTSTNIFKITLWYKWWGILFFVLVLNSNNYTRVNSVVVVGNFITWDDMEVDYNYRHQHHQHHHHHQKDHPHHQHHHEDVMIKEQRNLEFMGLEKNEGLKQSSRSSRSRVILVDQKGRGDSFTVQGAIDMVPNSNSQRVKIYILPGIYREKVVVPASKPYISFIGKENKTKRTVITWSDKASDKAKDGSVLGTLRTASVTIESDYFCATGITIQNSVVPVEGGHGMQAVALRIAGDKAMFYGVRILGTQDTLLDDTGSHYFYKCYIEGTVDFIFGHARSLYKNCILHSTAEGYGAIAAHHRDSLDDDTGFSFINCTINGSGQIDLGRAWGNYSTVVYSYCDIDDIINPSGWSDWESPSRDKTVVFGEFRCRGKGANRRFRAPWSKSFSYREAKPFLDMKFIYGEQWLRL